MPYYTEKQIEHVLLSEEDVEKELDNDTLQAD